MPLDERIARRLQIIRENLLRLGMLRDLAEAEFLADFRNVEAAKHLLQGSIEAMIDVAVHLLAVFRSRYRSIMPMCSTFSPGMVS